MWSAAVAAIRRGPGPEAAHPLTASAYTRSLSAKSSCSTSAAIRVILVSSVGLLFEYIFIFNLKLKLCGTSRLLTSELVNCTLRCFRVDGFFARASPSIGPVNFCCCCGCCCCVNCLTLLCKRQKEKERGGGDSRARWSCGLLRKHTTQKAL